MSTYIISHIANPDGTDKTDTMHTKRIGRRCSFISAPMIGHSLMAQCIGGGDGYTGTMRTSHVQNIAAVLGGVDVRTEDSIYHFRYAEGQIGLFLC